MPTDRHSTPQLVLVLVFKNSEDWVTFLFLILYSVSWTKVQPRHQVLVAVLCSNRSDLMKHTFNIEYILCRVPGVQNYAESIKENNGVSGLLVILKSQCYRSLAILTDIFMASQSIKKKKKRKDSKEPNMSGRGDCLKHGGSAFHGVPPFDKRRWFPCECHWGHSPSYRAEWGK